MFPNVALDHELDPFPLRPCDWGRSQDYGNHGRLSRTDGRSRDWSNRRAARRERRRRNDPDGMIKPVHQLKIMIQNLARGNDRAKIKRARKPEVSAPPPALFVPSGDSPRMARTSDSGRERAQPAANTTKKMGIARATMIRDLPWETRRCGNVTQASVYLITVSRKVKEFSLLNTLTSPVESARGLGGRWGSG